MSALKRNDTLRVVDTNDYASVEERIGEGGQGAVYVAKVGTSTFALKWYKPGVADAGLRRRIGILVERGSPDARFLWPIAEMTDRKGVGFGYLMPLAPAAFRPLADIFARSGAPSAVPLDLAERARVGIEIVDCFLKLHTQGFCYRDINLGSFLFDPASCAIRVCDNDNIDVNGTVTQSVVTLEFMAPELILGKTVPSADTDLHSLAVVVFMIILGSHPLYGRTEHDIQFRNRDDLIRLLGIRPLFMFDPKDASNGPVPGVHDLQLLIWTALPEEFRALFVRAFGEGLRAPRRRPLPTEWRAALRALAARP